MTLGRASAAVVLALLGGVAPPPLAAQTATAPRTGSVPAPTNLWAAQTSARELSLVWDSVPGARSFRLYRADASTGDSARLIGSVSNRVLRYVVSITSAMAASPEQRLSIEALDAAGLPSSRAAFNAVTVIAVPAGASAPPAPATVTAAAGGGGITVTWSAVPGATGYVLGRAVAPGGFRPLCPLCPTRTTYVDQNVTAGAKHQYTVAATTPSGTSRATRSNEITPTGGGPAGGGGTDSSGGGTGGTGGTVTTSAPVPPTNLRATAYAGSMNVTLTWVSSAGATSYRVSRRACSTQPTLAKEGTHTATPAEISIYDTIDWSTLNATCPIGTTSVTVYYTITSTNAAGSSSPVTFPPVTLTVGKIVGTSPPNDVSNAKVTFTATGTAVLTWSRPLNATTFWIQRSVFNGPFTDRVFGVGGESSTFTDQTAGIVKQNPRYRIVSVNINGSSPGVIVP